jgi:hypothetical protein
MVAFGLEVMDCYNIRLAHLGNLHGYHAAVATCSTNELNNSEMLSEDFRLMRFVQSFTKIGHLLWILVTDIERGYEQTEFHTPRAKCRSTLLFPFTKIIITGALLLYISYTQT